MQPQQPADKWYRRRSVKISLIATSIVLLVASVAAAVIFVRWQTSPDKVLLDATEYALRTPGVYSIKRAENDFKLVVNDGKFRLTGTLEGAALDAILINSTLYVKSAEPEKMYKIFLGQSVPSAQSELVKGIVDSVRNKWISLNLNNISSSSKLAGSARCMAQNWSELSTNNNMRSDVAALYLNNRFLDIKSVNDTTYEVRVDKGALGSFAGKMYEKRMLGDCSDIKELITQNLPSDTARVSVAQPETKLREIKVEGANPLAITPDYENVPSVTAPIDSIGFGEIQNKIIRSFIQPFLMR